MPDLQEQLIAQAEEIASKQAKLDADFHALVLTCRENGLLRNKSDFFFTGAEGAKKFKEYLKGHDHYVEWVRSH